MPIVDKAIETQIKALVEGNKSEETEASINYFSQGLAKIIADAIRGATVTVNSGIGVQVTPATGTGATITPGTGKLS
jgi:hypothetical protein